MDPYLRPAPPDGEASAPCPPGHVAEPAGLWDDHHQEVVYDPQQHDICIVRGRTGEVIDHGLTMTGWERARDQDGAQMWVRDRAAAARTLLASTTTTGVSERGMAR